MGTNTPLEALYALFKGEFGLNHRAFSQLILSDRPYQNGMSPQQMSMNTSWLSRSVVHAPQGSAQGRLFADFLTSARRVHLRLSQMGRSDAGIFQTIRESDLMPQALSAADQSSLVYQNVLARLATLPTDVGDVRTRAALLLTIAVGCTGSIAHAVELTSGYVRADGRVSGRLTPPPTLSATPAKAEAAPAVLESIALVRLVGGRVASNLYVIPASGNGSVIGALALGENAIADVGIDVSAEHLRVWGEHGRWFACDLGSKNGSALLAQDGSVLARLVPGTPVELGPNMRLRLAASTVFAVVAMAKDVRGGVAEMPHSSHDLLCGPDAPACQRAGA